MTRFREAGKDPITRRLCEIAEPFAIDLLHDKYSKQEYSPCSNVLLESRSADYRGNYEEAFRLYVQEACKQGYSYCSNDRFVAGFVIASRETEKGPTFRTLCDIAEPFALGFMYGGKYSEEEAFHLYAQEVCKLRDIHCSNNQFLLAFTETCSVNR
ncbi:hypothetical protein KSF_101970 [Reticulibacter mediterranei]|uniref:Uncharacterized protein n=1 Tax=Reticulibacter mediterranei TaxID=2778369 RepID=A0A8J3N6F5_9CHLR|nr:hypothetical protein KSF_101970 [Reticulibacter mediterranei]